MTSAPTTPDTPAADTGLAAEAVSRVTLLAGKVLVDAEQAASDIRAEALLDAEEIAKAACLEAQDIVDRATATAREIQAMNDAVRSETASMLQEHSRFAALLEGLATQASQCAAQHRAFVDDLIGTSTASDAQT